MLSNISLIGCAASLYAMPKITAYVTDEPKNSVNVSQNNQSYFINQTAFNHFRMKAFVWKKKSDS